MDFPHDFNLLIHLNLMFIHVKCLSRVENSKIHSRGSNHEVIKKFKISPIQIDFPPLLLLPIIIQIQSNRCSL